jgi:hypothetical protein
MGEWLSELLHPAEKCARVGHKFIFEWRLGYTRPEAPSLYRNVCDEVEQERRVCKRCEAVDPLAPEWVTISRHGMSGYSWPSSMAREFRENGEVWTETGRRSESKQPTPHTQEAGQ